MSWMLGGYMWLFVHRPFEVWERLGDMHIERMYMMLVLVCWLFVARKEWLPNPLGKAFIVFAVALVASWLRSPFPAEGQATVEDWFKVALFYVLVVSSIRSEKDLRWIVTLYVLAVTLYMAHSLREYGNGRFQYVMGTRRLLGIDTTFGDPNAFAATILYSLPMALALWPHAVRWWQRAFLVGYALLTVVDILLTSSRSGFVGLTFFTLMTAMTSRYRLRWLLLLAVLAPIAWGLLPVDRQNRFLTLIDPKYGPANAQESAEGRSKGFHDGVMIWNQYPLTGVGPGGFRYASGAGYEAHHLYGQILGELGSFGALAFLVLVGAFVFNAWEARDLAAKMPALRSEFSYSVVRATTQTVILLLLMGFSGHNLYRYTWLWFGAFEVIALHCMRQRIAESEAEEEKDEEDESNERNEDANELT